MVVVVVVVVVSGVLAVFKGAVGTYVVVKLRWCWCIFVDDCCC